MMSVRDEMAPAVRAIAALLAESEPQSLVRLREQFPEHKRLFDPVYVLGDESSETDCFALPQDVEVLRSFADVGLTAAEQKLEQLVAALTKRMKRARSVKLAGAIVASVSSVGVISALALAQREAALVTALVGLVASVAALIGEHLDQPLVGSQKRLAELLGDALNAEAKARSLRFEFVSGTFESRGTVFAFAAKVNEVAAKAREIMVYGGVSVT